jgi:hypothetical protein
MAEKICYFAIACDSDPDRLPPYRKLSAGEDALGIWRGLLEGVPALRKALSKLRPALPITWLLRCDRQIAEVYGDPAWSYRAMKKLWDQERRLGSELGWHPHLFRWTDAANRWDPHLGGDEDARMLEQCVTELRRFTPIDVVRTGWNYHSNTLMGLFAKLGMKCDASAIPGSLEISRGWTHDWETTPRTPYRPSRMDYRRPARKGEEAMGIVEVPTLVLDLPFPQRVARHVIRLRRTLGKRVKPTWESARWQGQFITRMPKQFELALEQWVRMEHPPGPAALVSYFHPDELLWMGGIRNFTINLMAILRVLGSCGFTVVPSTLSGIVQRVTVTGHG